MHRVCAPPAPATSDYYIPVAFFAGPNPETHIEALPGTYVSESDKLFPR